MVETISSSEHSPAIKSDNAAVNGNKVSLPPGVAEQQWQIKKSRETVQEIDLRAIASSEHAERLDRAADAIGRKLAALFPPPLGYKCSRKRYRPFSEWPNVFGMRLYVRRRLLERYEIQLEPKDSEYRTLGSSLCGSNLISEIRNYVVIALGVIFLLISLHWLSLLRHSLGEFAALTPVMLLMLVASAMGVCMGLFQLPINLLLWIGADKHQRQGKRQQMKKEIKELMQ